MTLLEEIHLLVVDDEATIRRLIEKELASDRRLIQSAGTIAEGLTLFRQEQFDVVVLDMRLPDGNGLDVLVQLQEIAPEIQVIIITGHGDVDNAVQAMKLGAYDYITKPFELDRLELIVEKAFQRTRLQRENQLLRHAKSEEPAPRLIGRSQKMDQVRFLAQKVAPTDVPVLLTGESGTGKNLVAQLVHDSSQRNSIPMVTKNCGTFQKDLLRSELFGHRKGAFTGATDTNEGLLSFANQGTLFLDEVGELSMEVQSGLLRVIENQTYRSVGDKEERKVNVRFIFATNRDLRKEVESGRFSEALYHRLNVFMIPLPPLRERKEDIPLMVEHFLGRLSTGDKKLRPTDRTMQCFMTYDWPGNVREMHNVLERSVILSDGDFISEQALPLEIAQAAPQSSEKGPFQSLDEVERQHILAVLNYVNGSRTQAADILGIGRKTLYRKLKLLQ
jgi:two-component system, NtrC family, response regulator